jgi:hypothetical protein
MMKDYQLRVVNEASELGEKIILLSKFLFGAKSEDVDYCERRRMTSQLREMQRYYESLTWRIENFSDGARIKD